MATDRPGNHGAGVTEFHDFVDSPAAAKVNGYLCGCGSLAQVRTELSSLGLSAEGAEHLLSRVR
jgi:hypothetical protein